MTKPCDVAEVRITGPEGENVRMSIPAFTRPMEEMDGIVKDAWEQYKQLSEQNRMLPCVGDFAMFLLSKAALEPFEQEDDES